MAGNIIHTRLTLDEDTYEAFTEAMGDRGCSQAEILREALDAWLADNGYTESYDL